MEIKCNKCNKIPKIEIFDEIQSLRFICDDSYTHFGLLTVNNFYKNFVFNNNIDNMKEFASEFEANEKEIINKYEPSVYSFIKFQKEFKALFQELKIQYQNLIDYLKKILFIKNEIYKNNAKQKINKVLNNEMDLYYYKDIIIGLKELIDNLKEKILIKEEYPKIVRNGEIDNSIKNFFSQNDFNLIITDFEYYNYTFNKTSLNIKKIINFQYLNEKTYVLTKKTLKLNDILKPAKFIYSYSLMGTKRTPNTYIDFYDINLQKIYSILRGKSISDIYQLKDGALILIEDNINIIKVDINNKSHQSIQIIDHSFYKILEIFCDNRISILMSIGDENIYLIKDKLKLNKYSDINIESPKISTQNSIPINNNNLISIKYGQVLFYRIDYFYDDNNNFKIKILDNGMIKINEYLNSGICYVDKDKFFISGISKFYLFSLSKKEIISIIENNFVIKNIFMGAHGEFYIYLEFYNKKFLKQLIYTKNEILDVGCITLKSPDIFDFDLIDLGENLCYI